MKEYLEEKKQQLFDGELTITKIDFWLIVMLVFTVGVLYGLLKAPWTHGVTIGSNNGNNNYTGSDCDCDDCDCGECECIGCCECEEDDEDEDIIPFN